MTDIQKKLLSLLSILAKDMNKEIQKEKAEYIVIRISQIFDKDIETGKLRKNDLFQLERAFSNISRGEIDCRDITVVCIMKCLSNTNYGIYSQPLAR